MNWKLPRNRSTKVWLSCSSSQHKKKLKETGIVTTNKNKDNDTKHRATTVTDKITEGQNKEMDVGQMYVNGIAVI